VARRTSPVYSRDEITIAARETVARLMVELGGGGLAARFVREYAARYRRRALTEHVPRFRDLVSSIAREALLSAATTIDAEMSRRLGARVLLARRGARPAIDHQHIFRVEFFEQLARRLEWEQEDLDAFWRDLDLYARVAARPRFALQAGSRRGKIRQLRHRPSARMAANGFGPFADRCAFLLDSPLLEKARRAAARFHGQVEAAARKSLRAGFRAARARVAPRKPRPRRRKVSRHPR